MDNLKEARWKQRFQNLNKAFLQLKRGKEITSPNELEAQGIIHIFEFTFEFAWKTLKDYLESQGVEANFPKEVIKLSFHYNIIDSGDKWLEMLANRNLLAHTYDEALAKKTYQLIVEDYYFFIEQLIKFLENKLDDE